MFACRFYNEFTSQTAPTPAWGSGRAKVNKEIQHVWA